MDEMKEGCQTSGILRDRPKELFSYEHELLQKEKRRMTVKEAEVGRAATATMGPGGTGLGSGTVSSLVPKGRAAILLSPQGRSLSQRLFLKSRGICPARFLSCLRP